MQIYPAIEAARSHAFLKPLANERGMALIISISLLAIMSILGALLMSSSSTEIQLSGNYRMSQESFYAADRAVDYAMLRGATGSNPVDLSQTAEHRNNIAFGNSGLDDTTVVTTDAPGTDSTQWDDRNSVMYIGSGPPPVGSGSDVNAFKSRNYRITTVGVSPLDAANPARTQLRTQVAKVVPK